MVSWKIFSAFHSLLVDRSVVYLIALGPATCRCDARQELGYRNVMILLTQTEPVIVQMAGFALKPLVGGVWVTVTVVLMI